MTDKEITRFKHLLQDYKSYQQEINRIQEEIKDLEYKKHPYHSPSLTEPIGKTLSVFPFERVERINTLIEEKEKEIDAYTIMIQITERTLRSIPDPIIKKAMIKIYMGNGSAKKVAKELGYADDSSLYKAIRSCLEKI